MEKKEKLYQKGWFQLSVALVAIIGTIATIWGVNDPFLFKSFCNWFKNEILSCVIFWIVVVGIIFFVFYKKGKIKVLSTIIKQKESKISNLDETINSQNDEINQKKSKIDSLNETIINKNDNIAILENKTKPFIERWEDILDNGIRFGSIKYPPMLDFDAANNPVGIGIDLLEQIFNGKIKKDIYNVTWQNLVIKLKEKNGNNDFKMDIIATPIFEINERSKKLSSSLPIFYTEIGLYYNSNSKHFKNESPMSFNNAINFINNIKDNLFVQCIESELSCRMVKKHFKGSNVKTEKSYVLTMETLLETVINDEEKSDFVFAEKYQADKLIRNKISNGEKKFKNLKNLFAKRQLLYPVVFVMRREDYILKNYINLKLIELDGPGCGISELIKKSLNSIGENITDENLKKYFIREYKDLIPKQD